MFDVAERYYKRLPNFNSVYSWLDLSIFPKVTAFWAQPLNIILTMMLFVPMVAFQADVILILLLNSWMNMGSFSTSQITLRAVLMTAATQERRAQETHDWEKESHEKILAEFDRLGDMMAELQAAHQAMNTLCSEIHIKVKAGDVDVTATEEVGPV